jgi:tetratricopeptide (TPR) repeat protein
VNASRKTLDRSPLRIVVSIAALVLLCTTASSSPMAQGDDMSQAREAFARGQQLFDDGDYRAARKAFGESLAAFPHYRTLFNIALCEEKLGRIAEAVEMYQRYVDWPSEVPNREEVAAKLAELRAQLPPEPEPPADDDEDGAEVPPEPPAEADGPNLIVPGWIVTGVGAAGMITGGVLLGLAQSRANEIRKIDGEVYDPAVHDELQDEGRTFEKTGWIVGGIGVAAVAAGVVLLLVSEGEDEHPEEPEVEAAVAPVRGGFAISAGWSF